MSKSFNLNFQIKSAPRPAQLTRHALFPTQIWQAQLPQFDSALADWARQVEQMRAEDPQPAGRSNRAGWNSRDDAVLSREAFAPLGAEITRLMSDAIAEMAGGELFFDVQSWVNMHDRGGYNTLHIHENALLSGCFYIRVPEGSGQLILRDPRPGVLHGRFEGDRANARMNIRLSPRPGLLVLFPNWLEHYVEPHEADTPRIAIAVNAALPKLLLEKSANAVAAASGL